MGIDAGSIYSEVRVRLSALSGDIKSVEALFDKMGTDLGMQMKGIGDSVVAKFRVTFASIRDVMLGPIGAIKEVIAVFQQLKAKTDELEAEWAAAAEASAILSNVLKTTGAEAWTTKAHLDDVAASLQEMTKYEGDSVTAMQGVLLGFRNITGKEFDHATSAILDMATVMKMDLTSAAQTVGKALDNPALGLDSLSRQGFKFTQQEKDLMKAMQDAGDIAGAQKIILDELDKTYGGAAKSAGELAVNLKVRLKNAQGDVNEEMGRSISEFLKPYREWLLKSANATATNMKAENDYKDAINGGKADYDELINRITKIKEGRVATTLATFQENLELDKQIEKLKALKELQVIMESESRRRFSTNRPPRPVPSADLSVVDSSAANEAIRTLDIQGRSLSAIQSLKKAYIDYGAALMQARHYQMGLTAEALTGGDEMTAGYDAMANAVARLTGGDEETGGYTRLIKVSQDLRDIQQEIAKITAVGLVGAFEKLGEAIASGEDPAKAFFKNILSYLGDVVLAQAALVEASGWWPVINPPAIIEGVVLALAGGVAKTAAASMATGGIVLPRNGGVPTIQAENGFPELDLNGGPSGRALLGEFADLIAQRIGAGQPLYLVMDGKIVAQAVARRFNNGEVRID
jgi:hypothetical protein